MNNTIYGRACQRPARGPATAAPRRPPAGRTCTCISNVYRSIRLFAFQSYVSVMHLHVGVIHLFSNVYRCYSFIQTYIGVINSFKRMSVSFMYSNVYWRHSRIQTYISVIHVFKRISVFLICHVPAHFTSNGRGTRQVMSLTCQRPARGPATAAPHRPPAGRTCTCISNVYE